MDGAYFSRVGLLCLVAREWTQEGDPFAGSLWFLPEVSSDQDGQIGQIGAVVVISECGHTAFLC